ncbi:hypothetical protein MLD38_038511 [Melastoma candidum]|uniref:Uncharacterized protein n=1 Tax=Melastoma candidum TaxID=119954 RepID=A0ACB9KZR0_9MYRT|nr:hypothetical protein MLD38_038511 [Melastoma candidum]
MVDYQVVCCMCGDVGFPDKLFRCICCRNRHQHSYCSNYYSESSEPIDQCDWCRSESRTNPKHGVGSSRKSTSGNADVVAKSEYSGGERVKQNEREDAGDHQKGQQGGKNPGSGGGAPSPRTATRRYKLLKDVMC